MTTDPNQIRSEIDQTQRELSADVNALTDKLSPQRIVERRVRRTRTVMTNMKDSIMGSTSHGASNVHQVAGSASSSMGETISSKASAARDTAASTASSAADAARSAPDMVRRRTEGNPLAAGLIAFGAGWLLSSLLPASTPEQQAATQVKDFATEQGRPVARQLGEVGQQLRESAQQRAESVRETAADAASTVAGEAQSAASDVTGHAQEAAGTVRQQAGSSDS
jgi:Protein of unknown function (DUF3618)